MEKVLITLLNEPNLDNKQKDNLTLTQGSLTDLTLGKTWNLHGEDKALRKGHGVFNKAVRRYMMNFVKGVLFGLTLTTALYIIIFVILK